MARTRFFGARLTAMQAAVAPLLKARVLSHFFVFSCSALMVRCITIVTAPLTMRLLSSSGYGLLALINSFNNITLAVAGLGLTQLITLEYFHHNTHNRQALVREFIRIYLMCAIPLFGLMIYQANSIARIVFMDRLPLFTTRLVLVNLFFYFFVELFYHLLQLERRAPLLAGIQTTLTIGMISLSLYLLYNTSLGVTSMVIAQLFNTLSVCCIALYIFIRDQYHRAPPISDTRMRSYLSLSLPLIPRLLATLILSTGDRWVLAYYCDMHTVGIYAVADLFSQLFYFFIIYPWNGSYLPYILKQFGDTQQTTATICAWNRRIMWYTMTSLLFVAIIGFAIFKPIALWILPPHYHAALPYVITLLMGQIVLLGTHFASCYIQFRKKIFFLTGSLMVPTLLNVGLNMILIPLMGIHGCTSATLIAYLVYFSLTLWYTYQLENEAPSTKEPYYVQSSISLSNRRQHQP